MAVAGPRVAVLLIDFQRAFLDGFWARHFGVHQVAPIRQAAERTAALFAQGVFSHLPVMASRCYLDPPDCETVDELVEHYQRHRVPWVWKPDTNITEADGFVEWLDAQMARGIHTLVIGGCTTTSCVRVSSQAVRRRLAPDRLTVAVDLSLCGARTNNYEPASATQDRRLVQLYGDRVVGRSAVDLAVLQMQEAGVCVVPEFDWAAAIAPHPIS